LIDAATFRLDGRLALVTGSSTGIGLALATGLAEAGARVVLNARNAERVEAAATALRAQGHDAQALPFDVCDEHAVDGAVAHIEATVGPIDILINNAGVARRSPVDAMSTADWRQVLDTNVDGVFFVSRAVTQRMKPRRRGKVIHIASVMSSFARPGTVAYATSKGAVHMLTRGMAADLAPHGINVNAIAPGYFPTELTAPIKANDDFDRWVVQRTPAGRWGALEDLAPAAVYLASDAARYVHGHVLVVDGGMTVTL
jgi:gluconate 5-dehydrogenase